MAGLVSWVVWSGQPVCWSGVCPVTVAALIPLFSSHQVYFKTPSGELQTVLLQEASAVTVAPSGTSCSSPVSRTSGTGTGGKKPPTRKERTLPKIAPAGGIISLNAAQLAAAAQAMQTININGVQVQGVPVTITNTGGGLAALCGGRDGGRDSGTWAARRSGGQEAPAPLAAGFAALPADPPYPGARCC